MGPHPTKPDAPDEVEHDETGQPETAPEGTPATGFPEPPGKDPGDKSRDPTPHHSVSDPAD